MDTNSDNSLVSKVMTFKSGNFPFSRLYDRAALATLLVEVRVLKESVEDLPILPGYAAQLKKSVIFKTIHSTAALEGNPLSEQQVEEVLDRGLVPRGREDAAREIKNLEAAYQLCKLFGEQVRDSAPTREVTLNEGLIKDIHRRLTEGVPHPHNQPGRYRDHEVSVGDEEHGGIYKPPRIRADIDKLMPYLVAWLNSPEMLAEPAAVRAALAHYHLALIHPFSDGNGRAARIIEALLLRPGGFRHVPVMLSNYYYQNMDYYYWAFTRAEKAKDHDVTPFVEFMLKGLAASLRETRENITVFIRLFSLREHYYSLKKSKALGKRPFELLSLLLDHLRDFSLQDLSETSPLKQLYQDVSQRTARRDLDKLVKMELLRRDEQGRYFLNLRALG